MTAHKDIWATERSCAHSRSSYMHLPYSFTCTLGYPSDSTVVFQRHDKIMQEFGVVSSSFNTVESWGARHPQKSSADTRTFLSGTWFNRRRVTENILLSVKPTHKSNHSELLQACLTKCCLCSKAWQVPNKAKNSQYRVLKDSSSTCIYFLRFVLTK